MEVIKKEKALLTLQKVTTPLQLQYIVMGNKRISQHSTIRQHY